MAIRFLSSENIAGDIDINLSKNGITYLAVTNTNTGVSANARVQVVGESSQLDLIATSAGYTGVSGWADSGIISTDSGASGGLKLNSQAGGIQLQSATATHVTMNSSGNVGIGDTSPQGKLEVNNRDTATGAALFIKGGEDDLDPVSGQYTGLAFGYGGGDIYNNGAILWEFTTTAANGKLHFAVNPTSGDGTANLSDSKMTILDYGNVGIGTTSPSSKFQVEGAPANGVYLSYLYNSATHNSANGLNVQTSSNNILTYGLRVNTAGDSNALAVMGNGSVGIGTGSPSTKLNVANAGEVIVRSSMTAADGYRGGFEADNQHTGGTIWSMFSTNNSDGYFGGGKYVIANESMGGVDANTTAQFVIDGSGNVGIQNTSPSSFDTWQRQLVVGNGSYDAGITIYHGSGGGNQGAIVFADGNTGTDRYRGIISYNGADEMKFFTSALERIKINDAGNVFISTPITNAFYGLSLTYNNTNTADFTVNQATGQIKFGGVATGYFPTFYSAGTEIMRINSSGNVGIGTTSPATKLNVSSTGTPAFPNASGTTLSSGSRFRLSSIGGPSATLDMGIGISGKSWLQSRDVTDFSINYPFLINPNGGNVGIGTTSPSSKLEIVTAVGADAIRMNYGQSADIFLGFNSINPRILLQDNANIVTHNFQSNGDNYIVGSNVGIGATNPGAKLSVQNTSTAVTSLLLGNNSGSTGDYQQIVFQYSQTDTSYRSAIRSRVQAGGVHGGNLSFWTDQNGTTTLTERMTIDRVGNVGIGTTSPEHKLVAIGTIGFGLNYNGGVYVNDTVTGVDENWGLEVQRTANVDDYNTRLKYYPVSGQSRAAGIYDARNSRFSLYSDTNNNPNIIIPNGNVGIGTTAFAPTVNLQLKMGNMGSGAVGEIYDAVDNVDNSRLIICGGGSGSPQFSMRHYSAAYGFDIWMNVNSPWDTYMDNRQVNSGFIWRNNCNADGSEVILMDLDGNSGAGTLTVKGDIVAYGSPSDKRLKENIKPIESALDKVSKLQGVTFDWKESDSILNIKEDIGFIAQDVQKVIPELVRENEDGMLSMRHQGIAPILLEAIKELKAEIEELKKHKCNCKE